MGLNRTTFLTVLLIGAFIVYLYVTGTLNNASNLTAILLFGIFALAFALEFDVFDLSQRQIPEIKITENQTAI